MILANYKPRRLSSWISGTGLVACFVHDVFEGLAGEEATDLCGAEAEGSVDELRRGSADVRCDEAVGGGPEGVCGWEGFGVGDVEGGAYAVPGEGVEEGAGGDDGAAGGVDEESAGFEEVELGSGDEVAGRFGEGNGDDEDVGLGKEMVEIGDGADRPRRLAGDGGLGAGGAGDAEEEDAEGCEAGLDGGSDGAITENQDGFAGEVVAEDAVLAELRAGLVEEVFFDGGLAVPLPAKLEVAVEREALKGGEDGGEDPLGGGDVVDAAAVAEGDGGGEPGGDPVDAGHQGLDDLDAAETAKGIGGVLAGEGEDPEVDVVGGGGGSWDADDRDFRGEVAEEFRGKVFIDADAQHASEFA